LKNKKVFNWLRPIREKMSEEMKNLSADEQVKFIKEKSKESQELLRKKEKLAS